MTITLNHTIVPARDKVAGARFFARIFGLKRGRADHFAPIKVNKSLTLLFDNDDKFESHHLAFHVSNREFDAILRRLFGAVANLAETRVIEVLFAAPGVAACRLQVAIGERTDPHILPGRRDDERADALDGLGVGEVRAVAADVEEAAARFPPPNTRPVVSHVAQAGRGRRQLRLGSYHMVAITAEHCIAVGLSVVLLVPRNQRRALRVCSGGSAMCRCAKREPPPAMGYGGRRC